MRAIEGGLDRGFERLSDRVGGASGPLSLLQEFISIELGGASGTLAFPAGTALAHIICLGGGGPGSGSSGGSGGGTAEYVLAVGEDGLSLNYSQAQRVGSSFGNAPNSTVTLPLGLGTIIAAGGAVSGNEGNRPVGSGPAGTIVRSGGAPNQIGEGVFAGRGGGGGTGSGGGGASPIGGNGKNQQDGTTTAAPGGGGSINSQDGTQGAIWIRFYGYAP